MHVDSQFDIWGSAVVAVIDDDCELRQFLISCLPLFSLIIGSNLGVEKV